jgi:RNA polymerase sigma-70 factor (ECF subfamily)
MSTHLAVPSGCGSMRNQIQSLELSDLVQAGACILESLVDVTRKRPHQWWRDDFTVRFAAINGLPGVIVDSPEGPVQTAAFEIDAGVIRALYVVRNPDKLRHLAATHERRPG